MAKKPTLSLESLTALGAEKLAQLVLDETEDNAAFRKRANAALVAAKGPEAVAALVDRRLAALEKARAMVAWEKEPALAADLDATASTVIKEVGPLAPALAVRLLLRFIDTHAGLFNRIDDSSGRIQAVYWQALEALPGLVEKMSAAERAALPDRLMSSLAKDTHELAHAAAVAVVPLLPEARLVQWNAALQGVDDPDGDFLALRQAIADARGDLDAYLALEVQHPAWRQNGMRAAEKLLGAGRFEEALAWLRRTEGSRVRFASHADLADGLINITCDVPRTMLEARILDAMKDHAAAQALRWAAFESTLQVPVLREYLRKLDDFIEYEELERAFAYAESSPLSYQALAFFVEWPRLDRAAKLVLSKPGAWDGRHYDVLAEVAPVLEADFPLAATVLYRALLDDILTRAKSAAYGHGARHLARLEALAPDIKDWNDLENHTAYRQGIHKAHGRKAAFWAAVAGKR